MTTNRDDKLTRTGGNDLWCSENVSGGRPTLQKNDAKNSSEVVAKFLIDLSSVPTERALTSEFRAESEFQTMQVILILTKIEKNGRLD